MNLNKHTMAFIALISTVLCMGGCLAPMSHQDAITNARQDNPSMLKRLAQHEDEYIRELVAKNPLTPVPSLKKMLHDPSRRVQICALQNDSLPQETVMEMAADPKLRPYVVEMARYPKLSEVPLYVNSQYDEIRESVAQDNTLDDCWYEKLSQDSNVRVRCYVASNQGCSPEILIRMMDDSNPYVKINLLQNSSMPWKKKNQLVRQADLETRKLIVRKVRIDRDWETILELESNEALGLEYAQNPFITTSALDRLAHGSSAAVRLLVAQNEKTTNDTLEQLSDDPDPQIRSAVMQTLSQRQLDELEKLAQQMAQKQRQHEEDVKQFKAICLHPRIAPMLREQFSIQSEKDIEKVLQDEDKLKAVTEAIEKALESR